MRNSYHTQQRCALLAFLSAHADEQFTVEQLLAAMGDAAVLGATPVAEDAPPSAAAGEAAALPATLGVAALAVGRLEVCSAALPPPQAAPVSAIHRPIPGSSDANAFCTRASDSM